MTICYISPLHISVDVTTESLLMVLPYENLLQLYDIKGKYLQEALELAVGVPCTRTFASKHLLQLGGKFRYRWASHENSYSFTKLFGTIQAYASS